MTQGCHLVPLDFINVATVLSVQSIFSSHLWVTSFKFLKLNKSMASKRFFYMICCCNNLTMPFWSFQTNVSLFAKKSYFTKVYRETVLNYCSVMNRRRLSMSIKIIANDQPQWWELEMFIFHHHYYIFLFLLLFKRGRHAHPPSIHAW